LHNPFDFLAVLIIVPTQLLLSRQLLAAAARRLNPGALRVARWLVAAFFVFTVVAFALGFSSLVSGLHLPAETSEVVGAIGQVWMFASTAGYLVWLLFQWVARKAWPNDFNASRRRFLNATGTALAAAPFALIGYGGLIERLDFHVREIDVPIANLPDSLVGLRLVQVSDIHLSAFLSERQLARVIDSANELKPHVALVTGDLITSLGDPLDACLRQVARLRADAGILGCMGNHEDYALAKRYTERAGARLGIQFLRDRAVPLRFGDGVLNLAGVDYQRSDRTYLVNTQRLILPGACNVLLSHNPDVFPVAAEQGYDLTVAGHTHGGQVNVEIFHYALNPARFVTPYVYGLYRHGTASEYVTRGIGTIGVPARIGAPPEIALLRLRKA
jgi:predicted MPP superfamily phosphohydrolase